MKVIKAIMFEVRDFFKKRVTVEYPFGDPKIQKEYRGKHVHDKNKCIYCGLCAVNCPAFAIKVDKEKRTWVVDLGKCIFCGRCEEVCPTKAISFSTVFDMSDKNKKKLVSEGAG